LIGLALEIDGSPWQKAVILLMEAHKKHKKEVPIWV
jgi:hypothetical protein